jgi:hypothetical protein
MLIIQEETLSIWKDGYSIDYPLTLTMKADSISSGEVKGGRENDNEEREQVSRSKKTGFPDLYVHFADEVDRMLDGRDYCLLS